jgi:ABC-type transport system involved in multi-copper enzyme maturation permease subunit
MMHARRGIRLGLGPVFAYEWIISSRRWQGYGLRSVFAGTLLAALLLILSRSFVPQGGMTFRDLAKLGESFFIAVIGTQLTLVLLAAPAATAGAICQERATGTITHVLVTDLSDSEIVLGKLAARLVPVLGLVACALPLLAILTLLGGVAPDALAGAFIVTIGIAVLGCALALGFSLWAKRTHEAILGTYAVWGIWLLGRPFVALLNTSYGWSLAVPPRIADPYFLAFAPYWYPGMVSLMDYAWFLAITTTIAAVLAVLVVFRIRAVCTRVNVAKKQSVRGRLDRMYLRLAPARYLPGPSLDWNPVLWREWHRARPSRMARRVGALFLIGAVTASIGAIVAARTTFAMAWVNGLQVSIGMLLLSVTAATSLAEERVRGTLDVLLTTPLSTRAIVVGKWLGTFRIVPLLAVLPVLVVSFCDFWRWAYVPTVLMTLIFVFVCGAAITGFGLAMATWCAKVGRAVALTVSVYILVTVGWLFVAEMWFRAGPDNQGLMMGSPFFFAGELAADMCGPGNGRTHIGWAVVWSLAYALAAVVFLGATLATFNNCLGRVEIGLPRPRRGTWKGAKSEQVTEIAGEALDLV